MSIEQAKQVKITATNIKSSLISGNKKLRKIRIDENNFLKNRVFFKIEKFQFLRKMEDFVFWMILIF